MYIYNLNISGSKEKERRARRFARKPSFLQGKPPKDPVFFKKKFLIFWKPPHSTQNGGGGSYIFKKFMHIIMHTLRHIRGAR